ncbi:MAG: MerR family transcriptional regulator [Chromatiales bacterium]|jgi:DNA-binding transcriptional MerR regulator
MGAAPTDTSEALDGPDRGLYPIRTVSSLTGVNPVTLRAWERRYALIEPRRTPKGHRLYTPEQIRLIQHVVELLERGVSIGQVKAVLHDEGGSGETTASEIDAWASMREDLLQAISEFDEGALDRYYNEALSLYPVDLVIRHLILPVLRALGERWRSAEAGIAEEHFFVVYLRNKLGARFHHLAAHGTGAPLLTACLPGEHHVTGLLLFALSAMDAGFRLIMLGADTPLEQLPPVVKRAGCGAIVLSGSAKPARGVLTERLPALVRAVEVPVLVGGAVSNAHGESIQSAGAVALGSDIGPAVRELKRRFQEG